MPTSLPRIVLLATVLIASACREPDRRPPAASAFAARADSVRADSVARARQDSVNRTLPGYVVDSILPPAEEMRRFRAAFPGDTVRNLSGGSRNLEELSRRFLLALSRRDTAELRAMAVRGREFSDLYYPESPYARPPYRQPVSLAWRMMQDASDKGLAKLLRLVAGEPLRFVATMCEPAVREGRTTRYPGCIIRLVDARGDTVTRRYFGSVVERDGQFKFLSYTNRF